MTKTLEHLFAVTKAGFTPIIGLCLLVFCHGASADLDSAVAAMEDPSNPLVEFNTSQGTLYIELFAEEAPINIKQFLALIDGEFGLEDETTGTIYTPRYFNGMIFHKTVTNTLIQTGSPALSPVGGPPNLLPDEINGAALGLASDKVLSSTGQVNSRLNIIDLDDFTAQILIPLYQEMNITNADQVLAQQNAILARLNTMTVQQLYELQGYDYIDNRFSHSNLAGTVALANNGPNTNGPEFFINLLDAPWLDGKHTVIGSVIEGFDVAQTIGSAELIAVAPTRSTAVIYSARRVH